MKVAFVTELFPPFAPGGAEWSTLILARDLTKQGVEVVVLMPNLGGKKIETINGFKVRRFPFYLKLDTSNNFPSNFAFTNPLWFFWSAYQYWKLLSEEQPDVINIHGKYSIPPMVTANVFIKKPIVISLRDYLMVCNYGICLMTKEKACSLVEYFFQDFKIYWSKYVSDKNLISFILNINYAIWGKITVIYLKFFINRVNKLVALSQKHKQVLEKNGIEGHIEVISNSYKFKKINKAKLQHNVLFVGRITYGKGADLLLRAIPSVIDIHPKLTFTFVGEGHLETKVKKLSKNNRRIRYLGRLHHDKVQDLLASAVLTVVPSLWPDPLPRVGLESISAGTPIVTTVGTGLSEVLKGNRYGYVAEKTPADLAAKINRAINENEVLKANIKKDISLLKKRFSSQVANSYKSLYEKTLVKTQ